MKLFKKFSLLFVQYIGGCSVHPEVFSTSGGYHEYIGGYHEYIGGYHEYIGGYHEYIGDIMNTSGDVQYIMRCSVHWGDSMSTSGGYHEYIGRCSVHQGFQYKSKIFIRLHPT